MGETAVSEPNPSVSFRPSLSTRLAVYWPISDVSSDLTVEVGTTSFSLHKFPLVSKSGKIRKLLPEAKDTKACQIFLSAVPGGCVGFELAAKFCYGIHIEITLANVAMLRCVAHYLQLTEEFARKNLEMRTEVYLKELVLTSISNSTAVLHCCESLLPMAEEINLVKRLIEGIASNACKEQLSKLKHDGIRIKPTDNMEIETQTDWWGTTLAVLNPDFFQRVISAVKSKGLKQDLITKILINYAQNSLQYLTTRYPQMVEQNLLDMESQKKQRMVVEAIVCLLPTHSRSMGAVPMAFLSSLMKTAITSAASATCRADLERRIGLQLDQAILEDILIPAANSLGPQMYETGTVHKIYAIFLNMDEGDLGFDFDIPSWHSAILKVSKLLDNYLAEIALDSNLMPSEFIALAELLPDHARISDDGLYRAVDIFLEVHPNIKDSDRCRLCKTIDCQKLSQEARSHAAQNQRLPVQKAVQILYFEQIRLRNTMNGQLPQRSSSGACNGAISLRDNYASVRRENKELRLEVARMRMRLTELEKDHFCMKRDFVRPNKTNKILKSLGTKLSKLSALFRINNVRPTCTKPNSEHGLAFQKQQRHSIS